MTDPTTLELKPAPTIQELNRDHKRTLAMSLRDRRRSAGLCPQCGIRAPRQGMYNCEDCADRYSELREIKISRGLCGNGCGRARREGKTTCSECAARSSRYRGEHPGRPSRILRVYGITEEDYERRFAAQGGRCEICGGEPKGGAPLFIDHDHLSGKVRGLLCSKCNLRIGWIERATEADYAYIARHASC